MNTAYNIARFSSLACQRAAVFVALAMCSCQSNLATIDAAAKPTDAENRHSFDSGADTSGAADAAVATSPCKVFAHYMVAIRSYGGSVEGYKREIGEAKQAGIDGFALNLGSWRNANYKTDVTSIFQAAKELNNGFVLFFSTDMSGDLSAADIVEMMELFQLHPNYFHYRERPVLSTYGGEGGGPAVALDLWKTRVLDVLRAKGSNPFFVPGFFMSDYGFITESKLNADFAAWWNKVADGFFFFGAAGLPTRNTPSLVVQNEVAAKGMHDRGLLYMASVTPQYWGGKQTSDGRRYFEFNGGEGMESQWRSVIETQKADWVELVTWNDFGEASYFSPIDDLNKYWPYEYITVPGFFKSHAGETALLNYFIDWYRNGTAPTITRDQLFYFYRPHPEAATASNDPKGMVTNRSGGVTDTVFVTTLLTAPAELRVSTGGTMVTKNIAAGLVHTRVPFQTGPQTFELWRGVTRLVHAEGEPIVATPVLYNFNYITGTATAP